MEKRGCTDRLAGSVEGTKPGGEIEETAGWMEGSEKNMWQLLTSLGMMAGTFYRIGCIDLDRNSMQTIVGPEHEKEDEAGFYKDYTAALRKLALDYVRPEYRTRFLNVLEPDRIRTLMDGGAGYADVIYRRLENGTEKWVRSELMAMFGYGETHHRVMWYVKNISDEKEVEERLSKQLMKTNASLNLQLDTVLGGISGGLVIWRDDADAKYPFEYVSPGVAKMQGYTVEEMAVSDRKSVASYVYSGDWERVREEVYTQLAEADRILIKCRIYHKSGKLKWVKYSAKRVMEEDGVARLYGLMQDITTQEEQRIALHNAMTMQTQIVGALNVGIWAYTMPERRPLLLNREICRLFEYEKTEGIPDYYRDMQPKVFAEDRKMFANITKKIQKPGDSIEYIFRIKRKKGGVFAVQGMSKMLQFDDGQRYVLHSMVDVTERFRTGELLQRERRQYRDALLAGSKFTFTFDLTDGMINEIVSLGTQECEERYDHLQKPVNYDGMIDYWREKEGLEAYGSGAHDISREELLSEYAHGQIRSESN